jgi:hypothetical protein
MMAELSAVYFSNCRQVSPQGKPNGATVRWLRLGELKWMRAL